MGEAIGRSKDIVHLVLDGYPRQIEQAKWLVDELPKHERSISAVIVLNVPDEEISRRLKLRLLPKPQYSSAGCKRFR